MSRGGIALQQRTALAAALIGDPEVLLLDEPLRALDAGERHRLLRLRGRRQTILLASSYPASEVGLAAHVVYLRGGRVELIAPISALEAAGLSLSHRGHRGARRDARRRRGRSARGAPPSRREPDRRRHLARRARAVDQLSAAGAARGVRRRRGPRGAPPGAGIHRDDRGSRSGWRQPSSSVPRSRPARSPASASSDVPAGSSPARSVAAPCSSAGSSPWRAYRSSAWSRPRRSDGWQRLRRSRSSSLRPFAAIVGGVAAQALALIAIGLLLGTLLPPCRPPAQRWSRASSWLRRATSCCRTPCAPLAALAELASLDRPVAAGVQGAGIGLATTAIALVLARMALGRVDL